MTLLLIPRETTRIQGTNWVQSKLMRILKIPRWCDVFTAHTLTSCSTGTLPPPPPSTHLGSTAIRSSRTSRPTSWKGNQTRTRCQLPSTPLPTGKILRRMVWNVIGAPLRPKSGRKTPERPKLSSPCTCRSCRCCSQSQWCSRKLKRWRCCWTCCNWWSDVQLSRCRRI